MHSFLRRLSQQYNEDSFVWSAFNYPCYGDISESSGKSRNFIRINSFNFFQLPFELAKKIIDSSAYSFFVLFFHAREFIKEKYESQNINSSKSYKEEIEKLTGLCHFGDLVKCLPKIK